MTINVQDLLSKIKNNKKGNRPYVFVDGFNLFIRHYLVNQEISAYSIPVGGTVGFLRSLHYIIDTYAPEKVFVVWENGGGSPRRKSIFPDYKRNRAKMKDMKNIQYETQKDALRNDDETRAQQLLMLTKLLKTTPVCQVYVPETECDDIISYLVKDKYGHNPDIRKVIVSNDKDFYQLLDIPNTEVYDPATRAIVTKHKVLEKYGISARNFCLAKALCGDESDNIPGVPGIGFKTAAKRFPDLASEDRDVALDDLLETSRAVLSEVKKPPMAYRDLIDNERLIKRNWDLMYLNSSCLSATQISKVNNIVDTFSGKLERHEFINVLIKEGITISFDTDTFFMNLTSYLRS